MVLSKVGRAESAAICATSANCTRMPSSIAGWKCSLRTLSNGGAWYGRALGAANGLSGVNVMVDLGLVQPMSARQSARAGRREGIAGVREMKGDGSRREAGSREQSGIGNA